MLILALLFAGCVLVWAKALQRRKAGHAAIDFEPRTAVPWDGVYVAVAAAAYLVLRSTLVRWLTQPIVGGMPETTSPEELLMVPGYAAALFRGVCLSDLLALVISLGAIVVGAKASRRDLGFTCPKASIDLRFGAAVFLAAAVPAMLLQALLQALVAESKHPIGLALKQFDDPATVFWAMTAAIAIAPPVEEFLFRVVLQGWFEKVFTPYAPLDHAVSEASASTAEDSTAQEPAAIDGPSPLPTPSPPSTIDSFLPVVFSSFIFTIMHWSSGIDVVALFPVALGLGYLYRQTHRIWPGIVMHMLLNGFSMLMLLLSVKSG